jgi:hypothetical protein
VNRIGVSGFASTPMGQSDFREDYRRYNEATQEMTYSKGRYEDSAQVRVSDPPLYSAAKSQARAMGSAGVTADQIST